MQEIRIFVESDTLRYDKNCSIDRYCRFNARPCTRVIIIRHNCASKAFEKKERNNNKEVRSVEVLKKKLVSILHLFLLSLIISFRKIECFTQCLFKKGETTHGNLKLTFVGLRCRQNGTMLFLHILHVRLDPVYHFADFLHLCNS